MPNWYLYYRLMHAVRPHGQTSYARMELQDVLVELRCRANAEFPNASAQEIQDFFEAIARSPEDSPFTLSQALHLTRMEPWA